MVNELALDVENVFHWNRGPEERTADAGRISWLQTCLDALVWWSDVHHASDDAVPARADAIHGFGKLDPSGEAFTESLLTWHTSSEPRVDRRREFGATGAAPDGSHELILDLDVRPGMRGTFALVGSEPHAGETVLLEQVGSELESEGPHRFVLCSLDNKVTTFFRSRRELAGSTFLLAYNASKSNDDAGDPRVVSFPVLVAAFRNLSRLPHGFAPGSEITRALLTQLEILVHPGPPSRPRRSPNRPAISPPRPLASPIDTLRRVKWSRLIGRQPDSPQWVDAWGDPGFQQTVSRVMRRELGAVSAVNDDLARRVDGLVHSDPDDSLMMYRAFAILAAHYGLAAEQRVSLGAAISSDPELSEQFWEPYVLIQPCLPAYET